MARNPSTTKGIIIQKIHRHVAFSTRTAPSNGPETIPAAHAGAKSHVSQTAIGSVLITKQGLHVPEPRYPRYFARYLKGTRSVTVVSASVIIPPPVSQGISATFHTEYRASGDVPPIPMIVRPASRTVKFWAWPEITQPVQKKTQDICII